MLASWKNVPNHFQYKTYLLLNQDLPFTSEYDAKTHYENNGYYEKRKYTVIPDDFNYKEYLEINTDIKTNSEYDARLHYENHGYYEKRQYKLHNNPDTKVTTHNSNSTSNHDVTFHHFLQIYNTNIDAFHKESRIQFRYLCFKFINYIINIPLPEIKEKSDYEAVLIEYRCFPHIEFIIRNNILKLGSSWAFTVICGNLNYDYVKNICKLIHPNIKIIKTPFDNLFPSEYSKFLSSVEFWNLCSGKKILIYQEDSLIFKNNIEDFYYFDYIGAPWPSNKNDNKNGVGNGGLSLRTKDIMIKIINKINIDKTTFNSDTLEYMKNTNSFCPPEDVYFTKNMEDFNIGILADRHIASQFSTESIVNENSFAGHAFWVCNPHWEKMLYKYNVCQFKSYYDISTLEHRGGWRYILNELENRQFFSKDASIDFFDMMESQFLWNSNFVSTNRWCGIIHCTPKTPDYLECININKFFENVNFIKSLKKCVFIISLSPYITKYLHKKIKCELNLNIKIYTLNHPVLFNENIPLFDIDKFILNDNKMLIQIGQQLRKMSSIYLLNSVSCNKIWLTGTTNFKKMQHLLDLEVEYLKIDKNMLNNSVKMYYTKTFEEYDELLSKNLIFVDLFDAAANNTVLECIVRNTPIIVNRIEGVVDYLGEDYPLYFDSLEEIAGLIDTHKILQAHEYLKNMDKSKFIMDSFLKNLYKIVETHFLTHC